MITLERVTRPWSTQERLLDAAEDLFATRGCAATSLRNVTETAGANVAAVNCHLGSKEKLLRAIVERAMDSVNAERCDCWTRCRWAGGGRVRRKFVRAFVSTGDRIGEKAGERGPAVARFLARIMCEPDPAIRRLFGSEVGRGEGQYLDALIRGPTSRAA